MKGILGVVIVGALCVCANAQSPMVYYGTHVVADQVPRVYGRIGTAVWFVVEPPTPASYYTFHNVIDPGSVQVAVNGRVLTARVRQDPPCDPSVDFACASETRLTPEYQFFIGNNFVMIILDNTEYLPGDRVRVSYAYITQR